MQRGSWRGSQRGSRCVCQRVTAVQVAALPTGSNKDLASPRLVEAALWALARWTDTYGYVAAGPGALEVEEEAPPEPPSAAARLLAPPDVAAAATQTLSAVVAAVTQFPGETALHTVAVERLLHAAVCRPGRSGHLQQARSTHLQDAPAHIACSRCSCRFSRHSPAELFVLDFQRIQSCRMGLCSPPRTSPCTMHIYRCS